MLRVVFDTDVVVAGFSSAGGASRRLLLAAMDGRVRVLLSTALLLEYEAVLTRPRILDMSDLTVTDVQEALDELASVASGVAFDYRWRPIAQDPDDDLVLETAINGTADVVASFNVADMVKGASRFGIFVERPATVIRRIEV